MKSRYLRFHGTRQQQIDTLRKEGWQVLILKAAPVVVAFQDKGTSVWVKTWLNKADKHDLHLYFSSIERAQKYMAGYIAKAVRVAAVKAEQKASLQARRSTLKASDHWAVGDVLYNSWGYEQTNIDWYQVVEVKPKSIVIRAIKKNFGATGHMQGVSQPRRGDFCGEATLKPLDEGGRVSMRHGCGTKWDGSAVWESSYH